MIGIFKGRCRKKKKKSLTASFSTRVIFPLLFAQSMVDLCARLTKTHRFVIVDQVWLLGNFWSRAPRMLHAGR